jgi:transposase
MSVYVGIDVAKRQHRIAVLDASGVPLEKPFSIANTYAGMSTLLERLSVWAEAIEIGLEATGHYWLALFEWLTRAGFTVHVLNPLQVHAYQRSGIRKRKNDTIDAVWIADFVRIGGARHTSDPTVMPIYMQLRQLSRFRFSLVEQIGDTKRRILSLLDQVFPEYESLFSSVFLLSSRQLLADAVTAQEFADFDLDELTRILKTASRGRLGREQAENLQQAAQRSVGVTFLADASRIQMGCLIAQLDFLTQQVDQIDGALTELVTALPDQYLTTIPGIGPVTAAAILGEIGDIQRFETLKQLVAYAGIDPAVYQSGQFEAKQTRMSKRGSPYLRHALWMAATVARLHDPELKAYYHKRRGEGKAYGTVIGAICRKLLARIFVILRDQRPYQPRRPSTI